MNQLSKFQDLEELIGIKFHNFELISRAFIHKSYVNESKGGEIKDNERLEFLGDAVLELATTRYLFDNYPDKSEGDLTSYRSALVKGKNLAQIGQKLGLGKYLLLSKGEEKSGGRGKSFILANTLEALIGAIYLDHGYEIAEKLIQTFMLTNLEEIIQQELHIDAKSRFQELCQEKENFTPHYEIISEDGPDHSKQFTMGAYIGEELIAKGEGSSKQKAEEQAAQNALMERGWDTETASSRA